METKNKFGYEKNQKLKIVSLKKHEIKSKMTK